MKNRKYRICQRSGSGKYFIQERFKILSIEWWTDVKYHHHDGYWDTLEGINDQLKYLESRYNKEPKEYRVIDTEK